MMIIDGRKDAELAKSIRAWVAVILAVSFLLSVNSMSQEKLMLSNGKTLFRAILLLTHDEKAGM